MSGGIGLTDFLNRFLGWTDLILTLTPHWRRSQQQLVVRVFRSRLFAAFALVERTCGGGPGNHGAGKVFMGIEVGAVVGLGCGGAVSTLRLSTLGGTRRGDVRLDAVCLAFLRCSASYLVKISRNAYNKTRENVPWNREERTLPQYLVPP